MRLQKSICRKCYSRVDIIWNGLNEGHYWKEDVVWCLHGHCLVYIKREKVPDKCVMALEQLVLGQEENES